MIIILTPAFLFLMWMCFGHPVDDFCKVVDAFSSLLGATVETAETANWDKIGTKLLIGGLSLITIVMLIHVL